MFIYIFYLFVIIITTLLQLGFRVYVLCIILILIRV